MTSDNPVRIAVAYADAASEAAHPQHLAEAVCVLLAVADHLGDTPQADSARLLATLYARRWQSLTRDSIPTTTP